MRRSVKNALRLFVNVLKNEVVMLQEPIIKLENISMQFPGVLANDRVSLDIKKGEVFALVGENGAGKSTLMNILYGLHTPTDGSVYINCLLYTSPSPRDRQKSRMPSSA